MSGALSGRLAVVTGGTRGIGAAVVTKLLADGARVIATGTRPDGHAPDGAEYHAVDFTDSSAAEAFANDAGALKPDILVNNAGINRIAPFAEIDPADFDRIHAVNVRAPMLLCRAVVPSMRAQRWGRIINIGSVWGTVGRAQRASYSASKFGVDGLTASLAAEVAADGILVNTVSPGVVETELTREVLGAEGMAQLTEEIPAGRLAQPDEIASFIVWLVGPENTYISGQNLVIDGGLTRS